MKNKDEKFSDYIIAKEGQKPLIVKPEALKKLANDGNLLGDDLVFCDLQKVWKKARNVKGLRTLFSRLESRIENITFEPNEENFDVTDSSDQKTSSDQSILIDETIPPLTIPINNHSNSEKPKSFQDAFEKLRSNSNQDSEEEEQEVSFYSKYCKPRYLAFGGVFITFYLAGYYLFFSPTYSLPKIQHVIHGKVMLDNKPLVSGAVIAIIDGKENSGTITPSGTYSIQNLPKGDVNFRIVSFVTVTKGLPKPKNISIIPPIYSKENTELAFHYEGGIKVFDINLKLPTPAAK